VSPPIITIGAIPLRGCRPVTQVMIAETATEKIKIRRKKWRLAFHFGDRKDWSNKFISSGILIYFNMFF
jgi:hypothetical protein